VLLFDYCSIGYLYYLDSYSKRVHVKIVTNKMSSHTGIQQRKSSTPRLWLMKLAVEPGMHTTCPVK
jgi:hypothetical protein